MLKRILFVMGFCAWAGAGTGWCGIEEDIATAFASQNYEAAYELVKKPAAEGNLVAQFYMGRSFDDGLPGMKDPRESGRWYRMAWDQAQLGAKKGDPYAQFILGRLNGKGAIENKNQALEIELVRRAADQGLALAQHNLGVAYMNGDGVAKNDKTAVGWFRKAANKGFAPSVYSLGYMYEQGLGLTLDMAEALKWYRKAADDGFAPAQVNIGLAYQNGIGMAMDSTEAAKWYSKAAEQGNANAQVALGICHENGIGVIENPVEAAKLYLKAAEQGYAWGQFNRGRVYDVGIGVDKDVAEAVRWYRMAAEQGEADAQINLGVSYGLGEGVAEDQDEALKWYRKAAEQGSAHAQRILGRRYESGDGVCQNRIDAMRWYRKAAEQGDSEAESHVAILEASAEYKNEIVKSKQTMASRGPQSLLGKWGVSRILTDLHGNPRIELDYTATVESKDAREFADCRMPASTRAQGVKGKSATGTYPTLTKIQMRIKNISMNMTVNAAAYFPRPILAQNHKITQYRCEEERRAADNPNDIEWLKVPPGEARSYELTYKGSMANVWEEILPYSYFFEAYTNADKSSRGTLVVGPSAEFEIQLERMK